MRIVRFVVTLRLDYCTVVYSIVHCIPISTDCCDYYCTVLHTPRRVTYHWLIENNTIQKCNALSA